MSNDSVGKWRELLYRPNHSDQLDQIATALSAAQSEIEGVKKTEENPFFKSKYADLASVWDAIRGPFGRNGLSVFQLPMSIDGMAVVWTKLLHKSGQFIEGATALKPTKGDPQGMGSAFTYARRYSLMGVAGVAPDDDDGNEASQPRQERQKNRTPVKPATDPPHKEVTNKLKLLLKDVGVVPGDKDTADAVLNYLASQPQNEGCAVNWHMAASQAEPCLNSLQALTEAHSAFPPDCETPLLSIVREHQAKGPKATQ